MAVAAFKIGALADAEQVQPVAEVLADFADVPVVLEIGPVDGAGEALRLAAADALAVGAATACIAAVGVVLGIYKNSAVVTVSDGAKLDSGGSLGVNSEVNLPSLVSSAIKNLADWILSNSK